jgi:hypothetical protein
MVDSVVLLSTHGALMFLGWAVVMPVGIYVAAFERNKLENWLQVHQAIMVSAAGCILIAYIIALSVVSGHFKQTHQMIGHALFAWLVVQAAVGFTIRRLHERQRMPRRWYDNLHRISGALLQVSALVNIGFGLRDHPWANQTIGIAYGLYCFSIIVVFLWAFMHRDFERKAHHLPNTPPAPDQPRMRKNSLHYAC